MASSFGENGTFQLPPSQEVREGKCDPTSLFAPYADFVSLTEVVRDFPEYHESPVNGFEGALTLAQKMKAGQQIPVFYQDKINDLHIFPASPDTLRQMPEPVTLIYIGKPMTLEDLDG